MCEDDQEDALDEAKWDAQFAATPEVLDMLTEEAHTEFEAGLTDDCEAAPDEEE